MESLTDDQRWCYHAYDYGWRRVTLEDFSEASLIDSHGAWFSRALVAQAETMWRQHFGKKAIDVIAHRDAPTEQQVIEVEQICAAIRANLGRMAERNSAVFRGSDQERSARNRAVFQEQLQRLAQEQKVLGVSAIELNEESNG